MRADDLAPNRCPFSVIPDLDGWYTHGAAQIRRVKSQDLRPFWARRYFRPTGDDYDRAYSPYTA
jgi:hypothetical protein